MNTLLPVTALEEQALCSTVDDGEVPLDWPQLAVIVPVFNEVKTIEEVLGRVTRETTAKEILIVDDGSTDGTSQRLEQWSSEWNSQPSLPHLGRVVITRHVRNRGKGAAIRTALPFARSEYVVVQDADLEVSPNDYQRLLKPLVDGNADIVIGVRKPAEGSRVRIAFRLGIQLLNLAVRVLYGVAVRDEACCFKVLRTRDLNRMNLECRGFEFCPEVIAKAARLGLRFAEVPISYWPRVDADGKKLRLRDGLKAFLTLWKYRRWDEVLALDSRCN